MSKAASDMGHGRAHENGIGAADSRIKELQQKGMAGDSGGRIKELQQKGMAGYSGGRMKPSASASDSSKSSQEDHRPIS